MNMMNDQPQQAMPQPEPQQRKKRKATRLMEIKEPQTVDFNNAGQHSGGKQNTFANDCGVLTRKHISVKHATWKDVPEEEKEKLWLIIKVC